MTASTAIQQDAWRARLNLEYQHREDKTILARRQHEGPLMVQRPFYPEAHVCHSYIIHPPGGVVGGDQLAIDVSVGPKAHALLTTPASGKFYNSDGRQARMDQALVVDDGAILEWLPQDNIFYEGARTTLTTRVDLQPTSRFIGWEITCLGRPFSGKPFDRGVCDQRISVWREGQPLLIDRTCLEAGKAILQQPWGLGGHTVSGTLLATGGDAALVSLVRECLEDAADYQASVTLLDDMLVCRFVGHSAEIARRVFEQIWTQIREPLLGVTPCAPRIWRT